MDATLEGIEPILDGDRVRRNIFAPHMATAFRPNVQSLFNYPNAFEFQSRDGIRVESVIWDKYSKPSETIALGEDAAAAKRAAKLAATPEIPPDLLPVYAGYLEGSVSLIRAHSFKGVATELGERRCVPGVYEVEHLPEGGVHAHAHIILLDGYVDALRRQMTIDGSPNVGALGKKQAFPAAINMLTSTMESSGFYCHNGDHLPAPMVA